jgi:hypothetical protein
VWLVLSSLLSTAFRIATISIACLADIAGPAAGELAALVALAFRTWKTIAMSIDRNKLFVGTIII